MAASTHSRVSHGGVAAIPFAAAFLLACGWLPLGSVHALAGSIDLTITDTTGQPVPDAVVTVMPRSNVPVTVSGADATPMRSVINQRDETFIPYVVAVKRGGTVTFQNSDQTRHHVYSFSPIKQFQFIVTPGQVSPPVEFDIAGAAAIGCNIHDQMIAYVYVTDAPWTTITRETGAVKIDGLPAGEFTVTVWHPRLKPGVAAPTQVVKLPTQQSTFALKLAVLPPRIRSDDDMNMY